MITIMMPTYKRNHFLSNPGHPTLKCANNDLVDKLIIIWQNIGKKVPNSIIDNLNHLGVKGKVEVQYPQKNSLNNRFYPYKTCDCVLSIDDDYKMTNTALRKCYKIWTENKNSIVGVVPRFINETEYTGNAAGHNEHKYNIILTGGAMFHKRFLALYTNDKANLKLMDKTFNGEDIMFNFVHNNEVQSAPIYVHDDEIKTWRRSPGNSISERDKNHRQKRAQIYKAMKEKYGDVLVSTTKKYFV